jgi:hypothetical protein
MEKACVDSGMWHQKQKIMVKTIFSNKITMFKKTLEFKKVIVLCYG